MTILLNHCSLRLPKKPRDGHLYAFRLNINDGPMTGKLIIDPGNEAEKDKWLEALRNPAEYYRKHGPSVKIERTGSAKPYVSSPRSEPAP